MAIRLFNEHSSRTGTPIDWKIEIHDSSYVGDPIEFLVYDGAHIRFRAEGGDVQPAPMLASSLEFSMVVQNSDHEDLITDIAGASEGRFTVVVYKDTVFHWAGVINAPEIVIEDKDYPYPFKITAVDGLALLKNYEYRQDGTSATKWDLRYTGIDTITDIILRCLKKLPHVVTHFTGASKFLVTAINWYSTSHTATPAGATYDPFYYTELDNRFAVTGQSSGNAKFLSCYDVLSEILTIFNARVALFDGYFLIEQLEHRGYTIGSNDNYSRYYAYDGTGPTANTLTDAQDVGFADAIKKRRGGTYSFLPPVKSARVTQVVNAQQNLLAGAYFDSGTVETVTVEDIFADGLTSCFRVTGNLEWSFTNLGGFSGGVPFIARFRIKLQYDSLYAVRAVTYDNYGNWTYDEFEWSASLGYIEIPVVLTVPALNATWNGQQSVDFLLPGDATFDAGDLVFSVEFIEVNYYILGAENLLDGAEYTLDWGFRDPYCAVVYSPKKIKTAGLTPGAVNPKNATYEVIGSSSNTQTAEVKTILGDRIGTVINQWGGFLYNDSGAYEYTTAWGVRNGTRDRTIAQLLAKRIVEYQYYPKKIYRNTIIGSSIVVQVPIDDNGDGETYFLTDGTYHTDPDEMDGEWMRLSFSTAELTYAPVEYDTGDFEKTGPGGGGSSGGPGGVDSGGSGSGGSTGSANIYNSDGTVTDALRTVEIQAGNAIKITAATFDFILDDDSGNPIQLLGRTSILKNGASAGDYHSIVVDDGSNSNLVRTQAADGILLQSTGDSIQLEGVTRLTDIITSASLGSDQNNYAGFDGANVGRLTASTAVNITGIASGADGRILALHNVGSNPITLVNASASSTAANRFDIGEDYTLRASHGCLLQYDSTASRWRMVAADRLGRFTEAYTTSTATTASISADTPATNVGLALVPKGTGALTLSIPDGTSTGGNARGTNAIDLQMSRSAATEVAGGTYSFAAGRRNTASGNGSIAIGGSTAGNTASGSNAIAIGVGNTASNTSAIAIGNTCTASGQFAMAFNSQTTASGLTSTAFGESTTASGTSSTAFGSISSAYLEYQIAYAGGQFAAAGDAQGSKILLRRAITGTAQTELFLDGTSVQAILPATNKLWNFRVDIVGTVTSVGNGTCTAGDMWASWHCGAIKRLNTTTSIVGTVQAPATAQSDANMSTTVVTIDADDTNEALRIRITPPTTAGSTTVTRWVAYVHLTELGY